MQPVVFDGKTVLCPPGRLERALFLEGRPSCRVLLIEKGGDRPIQVAQCLLFGNRRLAPEPVELFATQCQSPVGFAILNGTLFVLPRIGPIAKRSVPHKPTRIKHLLELVCLSVADSQSVPVADLDLSHLSHRSLIQHVSTNDFAWCTTERRYGPRRTRER